KSSTVDGSTTFTQNVTVCRPMPATRDLSEIRFNCRVVRRSRRCHGGCVWREATVKANFVEIMSSLRSNKKYGLLQRDQNGNQALTYGEWLQCLSNHCTESLQRILCFHCMAWGGGSRQQIADCNGAVLRIDFAKDLAEQSNRLSIASCLLFIKDDARLVIACSRNHARNALVIGFFALL